VFAYSVLNFVFWSFEFVSDLGFRASDLVAAEQREAAPSLFVAINPDILFTFILHPDFSAGHLTVLFT